MAEELGGGFAGGLGAGVGGDDVVEGVERMGERAGGEEFGAPAVGGDGAIAERAEAGRFEDGEESREVELVARGEDAQGDGGVEEFAHESFRVGAGREGGEVVGGEARFGARCVWWCEV